jgi:hypothetical protein
MSTLSEQSRVGGSRSALAEAADRFDRLARGVKDQQLSETRSGPRIALTETYGASPEEAWAKKFMTQAIGPVMTTFAAPALPGFVPAGQAPIASQGFSAPTQPAPAERRGETASFRPGGDLRGGGEKPMKHMPRRRRNWIGWLLLGR